MNSHTNHLKTGADILIEALVQENVEYCFGYPGGAVLPIYDALYRSGESLEHILCRHEQGLIHAAEGYARVSGKAGVVFATSGPGATNLITGITDAMMDSLPIVIFTGQVAQAVIGTDAFQEADIIGITTPITKHNFQIQDARDIKKIVKAAFHIATTGRKGPVLVDIPKNIQETIITQQHDDKINLPGYQPNVVPHMNQINKLKEALRNSERPVVLTGAGIGVSGAEKEFKKFIDTYQIPVVSTLHGLGVFDGEHELFLGMAGMHGTYSANMAIHEADLLINIGSRFDDRLTGAIRSFAPNALVSHIDIDPAEIGKNIHTHIPIVADAKEALESLNKAHIETHNIEAWRDKVLALKKEYPLWYKTGEELISPQWLLEQIYEITNGDAIVTTDVGQHQMWTAQFYKFKKPRRFVTSGGLGTMGFGVPSAIGAQLAFKNDVVVSINGDGGFQMNMQELATIKEKNLPIKIIIINNEALGMVRQWQEKFYNERYSSSLLSANPDFVKLAEGFGIKGMRVKDENKVKECLEEAFNYDGPVLIDARVQKVDLVYPMVPAGRGNHEMIGVKSCDA